MTINGRPNTVTVWDRKQTTYKTRERSWKKNEQQMNIQSNRMKIYSELLYFDSWFVSQLNSHYKSLEISYNTWPLYTSRNSQIKSKSDDSIYCVLSTVFVVYNNRFFETTFRLMELACVKHCVLFILAFREMLVSPHLCVQSWKLLISLKMVHFDGTSWLFACI